MELHLSFFQCFYIYAMSVIIGAVSGIVPGGIGFTEGGLTGLLVIMHISFQKAVPVVLIFRLINLVFYILIGIVFLLLFYTKSLLLSKNRETKNNMKKTNEIKKAKFIYNPHAGQKRHLNPLQERFTLEYIKDLLEQYQIPVDYAPTRYAKHATKLAKDSIKEGYELVIAAGGDGTVGEVANGLVGSDVVLAILPLGTVMNVARMLAIPLELEKAVELIKIKRVRKIDVGSITRLEGEKMEPYYFLEQTGIGMDATMHYYMSGLFDKKKYFNIFRIIKTVFWFFGEKTKVYCDDEKIVTTATLVTISNGPLGGPALPLAPEAKLNDHKLTLSLFNMNRFELGWHLLQLFLGKQGRIRKVRTYQAEKVKVESKIPQLVHADARLYGDTPVEFRIVPSSLNVITGFPKPGFSALNKRTYLDP